MLDLTSHAVITVTAPTVEPVTLEQMKEHSRVDDEESDAYITALIPAARRALEDETGRAFMDQVLRVRLDSVPCSREILLPRAPLQSLVAITYINTAGATVTFTGVVDAITEQKPGRLVLRAGYDWPSDVAERAGAFMIEFRAGAASLGALDPLIVHGVRFLVHHWFTNREPVNVGNIVTPIPRALDAITSLLRVY
jgi:uncharacterized phiE125 gp8 family phage protein